ncbi:hypothetical protein IFM61392_01597 [Aspergillus lentulus]|nr:hypothetical protein IFM61392_01597 [Aspergillus lentulus]
MLDPASQKPESLLDPDGHFVRSRPQYESYAASDMLFTVKGPTAGAILMQWNAPESTQGSAGCHLKPIESSA